MHFVVVVIIDRLARVKRLLANMSAHISRALIYTFLSSLVTRIFNVIYVLSGTAKYNKNTKIVHTVTN